MRFPVRLCLLLAATGLLGMGIPPDRARVSPEPESAGPAEDAALIAELGQWEERAAAERYEFFQSYEAVKEGPPDTPPSVAAKEAK